MELFERLLILHEDPARIAREYAEYMYHDDEADRANIPAALTSLLRALRRYQAMAEEMGEEYQRRKSGGSLTPWDDFGGEPTQAQRVTWSAQVEEERARVEEERARVEAKISALDGLFHKICRALDAYGLTLTGGQISALKRAGLPDAWAEEVDTLKRAHLASISQEERLDSAAARAIYDKLTAQGLICGPYTAFVYYLGQVTTESRPRPGEGLKWRGNYGEFVYFARRLAKYTQNDPEKWGYTTRISALCQAFGITQKRRENSIAAYPPDHTPRSHGKTKIDAAFTSADEARAALDTSTTK